MGRQLDLRAPSARPSNLPLYRDDDPPQSSSASAHSLQPYESSLEPSQALPAYTDDPLSITDDDGLIPTPTYDVPGGRHYTTRVGSSIITFDPSLSKDPRALHALVLKQSHLPPKPVVRVIGNHTETSTDKNGKKTKNSVEDFNFRIDPGETLLRPSCVQEAIMGTTPMQSRSSDEEEELRNFRKLMVVEDADKALRGGRMKARAPGWKAVMTSATDSENHGVEDISAPHLGEWCTRFCNNPAGTRTFVFSRNITDWNAEVIKLSIITQIRSVNYRGNISVHFSTDHSGFTVYSPSIFKVTYQQFRLLWIITWPILWFLTRRYEVVSCQWPYARDVVEGGRITGKVYATGQSEEQWAEMWRQAVQKAAFGRRRKGEWIMVRDIEAAETAIIEDVERGQKRQEQREQARRGSGFMNAIVGIAHGVSDASAEYDRRVGWGANQD